MPNMVKIGCCEEHPSTVVNSLDKSGACPIVFNLEYIVFLNDWYPILQSVRRDLWANLKNVGAGWFYIASEEAITMIRHQIASLILNKFKHEIQKGYGDYDFPTIMRIINSVLIIKGDSPMSRKNDLAEAREVSKHIVMIMRNENWLQKDRWLGRVTKKNHLSSMSKHC